MSAYHIIHWEPLWKRKKVSRSEWRKTHGKNANPHAKQQPVKRSRG